MAFSRGLDYATSLLYVVDKEAAVQQDELAGPKDAQSMLCHLHIEKAEAVNVRATG